jgi:hypothetical protein
VRRIYEASGKSLGGPTKPAQLQLWNGRDGFAGRGLRRAARRVAIAGLCRCCCGCRACAVGDGLLHMCLLFVAVNFSIR